MKKKSKYRTARQYILDFLSKRKFIDDAIKDIKEAIHRVECRPKDYENSNKLLRILYSVEKNLRDSLEL